MNGEHYQMIEDCEARESLLSTWEAGFIDSAKDYMEDGHSLSPKQVETLEKIWDRVTARG